jgi:uncharacterized protein (TIGR00369 family)
MTLIERVAATHRYPLAVSLGLELRALRDGTAELGFTVGEAHLNGLGSVQGGLVVAMLDMCMTLAALGATELRSIVPTLDIRASFLAPTKPGPVLGEGRVRRLGRGVAFLEAELRDGEGKVLATGSATARVLPREGG